MNRAYVSSIDRLLARWGPSVTIGGHPAAKLPPPSPSADVIIARVLPPFPFLEILRSAASSRDMHISTYLCASHDIPRVSASYGTVHNSRVSGRAGLSRYQGRIAIGNATLVKTEIPRTSLKRKRSVRWVSRSDIIAGTRFGDRLISAADDKR